MIQLEINSPSLNYVESVAVSRIFLVSHRHRWTSRYFTGEQTVVSDNVSHRFFRMVAAHDSRRSGDAVFVLYI